MEVNLRATEDFCDSRSPMSGLARCCSAARRKLGACVSCRRQTSAAAHQDETIYYWSGRYDSLMVCLAYAIGLSNASNLYKQCSLHGRIAFFIPYLISVVLAGLPIVFLEMAFGQCTNMGPVHGWKQCPIMTGIGWSMCFIAAFTALFYSVTITWKMHYAFGSLAPELPWSHCNSEWNDDRCGYHFRAIGPASEEELLNAANRTTNCSRSELSSLQYLDRYFLGIITYDGRVRSMAEPLGGLQWQQAVCHLGVWVLIFLGMIKGAKTLEKLVYFTVPAMFLLLLVMLVRLAALPGAGIGIKYFLTPDFSKLGRVTAWVAACHQAFFSLSLGLGGYMTLASHNTYHTNCYRDAIGVVIGDTVVSIMCSLMAYFVLGNVVSQTGLPPSCFSVGREFGFIFITYSDALSRVPLAQMWTCLLFAMLFIIGFDSQLVAMETVSNAIMDQWPKLRSRFRMELLFNAGLCFVMFVLSLPMLFRGGFYLHQVLNYYTNSFTVHFVTIGEILGVCCFYGLDNFRDDIENMLGYTPSRYWTVCWVFFCPVLILTIMVFGLVSYERPEVTPGQKMSDWGNALGWGISVVSLLIVVGFAVTWKPVMEARRSSERRSAIEPESRGETERQSVLYQPGGTVRLLLTRSH